MNRRSFTAHSVTVVLAAVPHSSTWAHKPASGKDYFELEQPAPVEAPTGKVEVVEFFWYGCPHCDAFEPKLEAWLRTQPAQVAFRRVPVNFREEFVPQQKLYYALEAMNKIVEIHPKVFEAIHVHKQALNRDDLIFAFIERNGIDAAKFRSLYESFTVSTKARRATQLQNAYRIEGVPALGVAGRFYVDAESAGSMDKALQVVDRLVSDIRKSR
ncbi:MAG: thiol:disulfide interchange protein DsbA/DsbL [Burkholderiales bacterium]|nr:thiol:disulfide interchange protein DsbA/DsbL [Burkholderiales bacterium]